MSDTDLIGTGWALPVKLNGKGGLSWSSGPNRIQDSIWIIVNTSTNERLMRPTFGAGASDFVFESNSATKRAELTASITEALTRWEPRIDLAGVTVDTDPLTPSAVRISIAYKLRTTNELFNLVFPLYLQEGAG
jgi:phage baseplate assembly protein W